ncbi:hypothetical protein [Cohnella nanjingensis]|uniref:Histidine kinase N-terminal 7TM region domain-containing protein n=1 Tax=Cohnella nanjingensis TaxID=1387779 RepID=A0A7X0RZK0_9BACL|nr:hypothetical protein [Cohnella nanjingensis]MBB6675391.1 hypothetical protein [Cohnella nanjingensis]
MFSTISVLAVMIGIAAFESPALWRKKRKREIAVFAALLFIGAWLSVCAINLIQLPSALKLVEWLYAPLDIWLSRYVW